MQFQRWILDIYSHLMPKQWRGIQTFKQNCLSIFISKTFIVELILTNPLHVVCFRTLKWLTYCSSISFPYSSYFEVGFIIWFLQHHTGETFIRRMVFMLISKYWSMRKRVSIYVLLFYWFLNTRCHTILWALAINLCFYFI